MYRNRHLWLAAFWAGPGVVLAIVFKESVLFVALLSLYANFASEIAAHHALKAEKK